MSNYSQNQFTNSPNHVWTKVYNFITEGSKVLDIGCSSGRFGEALTELKLCEVDGIELDDSDVSEAKKRLKNVFKGNIEDFDLNILDEKYDFVVFSDVIEHLVDPVGTLKRIKQVLKPNGQVIFSIPNMAHISVRLMLLKGNFDYGKTGLLDNTHLHFYTKKEILRVFREAGFNVKKLEFTEIDYDELVLKQELAAIGLHTSKKALNFLSQLDAVAFQFVGAATPAKAIHKELPVASPEPEKLYAKYYKSREIEFLGQIQALQQRIKESEQTISSFKLRAKVYRVVKKVRDIRR